MKAKRNGFSRQYEAALRTHLKRRPASLNPAKDLGCQAMTLGLATLDLARIHERALTTLVLTGDEVNPVVKALRENGIDVTAIHSHMLDEQPRLFFLHFWANDDALKLARGMRAALDKTATAKS